MGDNRHGRADSVDMDVVAQKLTVQGKKGNCRGYI